MKQDIGISSETFIDKTVSYPW